MEEKNSLDTQSVANEVVDMQTNQDGIASSDIKIENVEITSDKNVIREEELPKTNKKIKILLISTILLIIIVALTFMFIYFNPINKADL
ncbi:MAG TPA: hypothetical protein PLO25_03640 [Candidatus Saccharibacteria bacterium]|nr:hypothetical protein [Candidatus Saccharibacteria bacterium]